MGFVSVVIFLIGAVLGTVLRFRIFLRTTLVIAAGMVILAIFQGVQSILMSFWTTAMFVIWMLAGAAIGRTLKQAFREG